MTLDDAIAHADWVADNCEGECSEDHRQLSEWLLELKRLRAENEELRSALVKALDVQAELCANRDLRWCREECSLYRSETNDCEACDPIDTAYRLGALPKGMLVCIPKDMELEELGIEVDQ